MATARQWGRRNLSGGVENDLRAVYGCAALHEFITAMNWCYSIGDNLEKELEEAGEAR